MDVLILAILFVGSALLLGYFRSPSYKGAIGERRVSSMFHRKLNQNYYIFNDVLLPTSNGTTQIDHLIVSIYGIFVIETKNMKGWIFGSANQKKWTQVIYKRKFSLYNPLHQNYKHLMAVKELINVNQNQIFVMNGDFLSSLFTSSDKYVHYIMLLTSQSIVPIRSGTMSQQEADKAMAKINLVNLW